MSVPLSSGSREVERVEPDEGARVGAGAAAGGVPTGRASSSVPADTTPSSTPASTSRPGSRPHLAYLRIDRFGAMSNRTVGPFAPGLNVVYGPNEAGKTTVVAFVGGVLFGWEEARGFRNTYRPEGAERAGSLVFLNEAGDAPLELRRVRNVDGLQGDVQLVGDLDKDTFRTMFSLSSDELRSLRDTADITAHLLTAGSGTGSSPARALAEVQDRLAKFTSRSRNAEESLVRLAAERADARRELARAAEEAERFRGQSREFHNLDVDRAKLARRLEEANASIEGLASYRVAREKLDAEAESLSAEVARLHEEEAQAVADRRTRMQRVGRRLAHLSSAEDRAMRDKIEALADRETKAEHALDTARSNFNASNALYETVVETQGDATATRHRTRRVMQVLVPALLFILLAGMGVPLFVQGRSAGSLSYAALGLAMVGFGFLLAAAAVVMLFRPDRAAEERKERLEDARWMMVQDKKKLEACEADMQDAAERIAADLEEMGLAAAEGSLRRARALLDEARDARAEMALDRQRQQAASARIAEAEARLDEIDRQRAQLSAQAGVDVDAAAADLDREAARRTARRAELLEASDAVSRRWGELKQILSQAEHMHEFDQLKLRVREIDTRIADATRNAARLMLAKRLLETAIASWESKSQPAVYARASQLLALMTNGRWTRVFLSDEGELRVADDAMSVREPRLLSLGTCQQLYLALRIALLECADNVGRAVPVLADDILVNFDAERRAGAARALAELAEKRQVILLTCHKEVVEVLRQADRSLNELKL